ncbi:hypothetical protein H5410_008943 [Solanum commersonii]|uniref:Myb/SANT-like domain-containing protein n=1 Tax=Solanum commersonii TaxID=4109 RepID=A0A9J6AGE5_SOLCO|nr:hypothetical protein H5410_008943 [Solanum commersonii]
MSRGFPIDVVGVDDASCTREDQAAKRNLMYQPSNTEQHKVHLLLKMNLMNQLSKDKVHSQLKRLFSSWSNHKDPVRNTKYSNAILSSDYMLLGLIKIGSPTKRRSNMSQKRARVWTQEEELTLVDGLKKLCANDWKEDDGTFKHGYLMELEQHMNDCHPNSGLQALPHIFSKIRGWKKHYMTLSLVKSQSGLGFRYSDGTILVEDPKAWDDFIKVDPYAKSMTFRKWPLFVDWEEIFRKDGATEQSAEGPEVGVQEIKRIEAQEVANDMSFEFPIIVVDEDDAPAKKEDQIAQGEPSVSAGATQSSWSAF